MRLQPKVKRSRSRHFPCPLGGARRRTGSSLVGIRDNIKAVNSVRREAAGNRALCVVTAVNSLQSPRRVALPAAVFVARLTRARLLAGISEDPSELNHYQKLIGGQEIAV